MPRVSKKGTRKKKKEKEWTEEELEVINREFEDRKPKIIECLKTKPFVEALNKVLHLVDIFDIPQQIVDTTETRLRIHGMLIEWTLKWLYDLISSGELSPEEREMRINQSVIICFFQLCDRPALRRKFKKYVVPLLIKPGYSRTKIVEVVKRKLEEVSYFDDDAIEGLNVSVMRMQIKWLDREFYGAMARYYSWERDS